MKRRKNANAFYCFGFKSMLRLNYLLTHGGKKIMNKVELVDMIASDAHLTKKDAMNALEAMLEAMTASLARGEDVKLAGFGNFAVKTRPARKGVNPSNGETIEIAAAKTVGFKASKALKDKIN